MILFCPKTFLVWSSSLTADKCAWRLLHRWVWLHRGGWKSTRGSNWNSGTRTGRHPDNAFFFKYKWEIDFETNENKSLKCCKLERYVLHVNPANHKLDTKMFLISYKSQPELWKKQERFHPLVAFHEKTSFIKGSLAKDRRRKCCRLMNQNQWKSTDWDVQPHILL